MNHDKKHPHPPRVLNGEFRYLIFSPRGAIEGLLLHVDGEPVQLVVDQEYDEGTGLMQLKAGQTLRVEAAPQKPSPKGEAVHEVYRLHRVLSVDGRKTGEDEVPTSVSGVVARLNFAKHGEPNGVVLDSGDFIHLKPEGMAAAKLKIGDAVTARGEARRLVIGQAHVFEAHEINGRKLKRGPAHAHRD